jgi:ketosteroid isomerase-like protein
MRRFIAGPVLVACLSLVGACATTPSPGSGPTAATPAATPAGAALARNAELERQVAAAERAFAKTMADRDHAAFTTFVSDEAIFFTGPTPLVGKAAVAAGWKRLYDRPQAPFSWEPSEVVVLASGNLALSSGPVRDPSGRIVATFTSVWRQEAPGEWRVIFDKGNDVCDCAKPGG